MPLSLILAVILLIPGLVLAFVPVVPALLYMFLVALGYAVFSHFARLSGWELGSLALLTAVGILIDHLSGILGAKWGGASRRAMLFGFIGAIIGTIMGGPLLGFGGVFLGIFLTEIFQLRPHLEAFRAASGGLVGALVGFVCNILLAFVFFIVFALLTLR